LAADGLVFPAVGRPLSILLTAVLAAALAAGCRKAEEPAVNAAVQTYAIKGVVRDVDAARSEATVAHEDIPNFMSAMTMVFPIKDDAQVVKMLRPGDKIEATLHVQGRNYWLEKIVTRGFEPTPRPVEGAAPPAPSPAAGVVTPEPNRAVKLGEAMPDFALTDQTGKTVRLSQLKGEIVAVSFLYTQCPIATACPMTTAKFSKIDAELAKRGFGRLLIVTVDPERDTPAVLADYAKRAGADPARWKFLTGSPKAVADVASNFGVLYYPEGNQIIHGQAVAIVDKAGKLSSIYYGERWEVEHIVRDMEKARNG
jgi:protein SCO1/2